MWPARATPLTRRWQTFEKRSSCTLKARRPQRTSSHRSSPQSGFLREPCAPGRKRCRRRRRPCQSGVHTGEPARQSRQAAEGRAGGRRPSPPGACSGHAAFGPETGVAHSRRVCGASLSSASGGVPPVRPPRPATKACQVPRSPVALSRALNPAGYHRCLTVLCACGPGPSWQTLPCAEPRRRWGLGRRGLRQPGLGCAGM